MCQWLFWHWLSGRLILNSHRLKSLRFVVLRIGLRVGKVSVMLAERLPRFLRNLRVNRIHAILFLSWLRFIAFHPRPMLMWRIGSILPRDRPDWSFPGVPP